MVNFLAETNFKKKVLHYILRCFAAMRTGGRFRWLWFGIVVHALFVENVCFWFPEIIDNYWHSQTVIVLLGRRLPLHIINICEKNF